MKAKPLVGVSACLLGKKVRHDGGHKRERWLVKNLSPFVEWVPVCPEVAMGLGTPREPIRLQRGARGKVKLVSVKSDVDLTMPAKEVNASLVASLPADIDGFILKSRSPSCGLERVKVYAADGVTGNNGTGFFVQALLRRFPDLPMIEESHLCDTNLTEHFLARIFARPATD